MVRTYRITLPFSLLALGIALLCVASPAHALTGPQVDPKAPCFRWPATDYDHDGVFDRVDNCPNTPAGCIVDQYGCSNDADGDGVCDGVDQCAGTPSGVAVDEHGCPEGGQVRAMHSEPPPPPPPAEKPVTEVERHLVEHGKIRLENVYFESGSSNMLPESEHSLREAGEALEKYPDLKLEVQGHTDSRGRGAYNMRLSQQRAETVRSWLLGHYRLDPDHVTAKGYGETQPETKERNEEEMFRNRRVEIKVLNPEALPKSVKVEQK